MANTDTPRVETIQNNGNPFNLYSFSVPMFHEDFHIAEKMGLVYAYFSAEGNDYWDYAMVFCKPEDKEKVINWKNYW